MILVSAFMSGERSPFEKNKVDFVNFKKNGVIELIKDTEVFIKYARFVKVKIKEL